MAQLPYSVVTTEYQLNADIVTIDANPGGNYTITFGADITVGTDAGQSYNGLTLPPDLYAITGNSTVTINGGVGSGYSLNGQDLYRGLLVYSGNVTIQNLTIQNAKAIGGNGGNGDAGGGGGAGLGGGLFVGATAIVRLNSVTFSSDGAQGGNGGNWIGNSVGGGGGGGLGGNGGNAQENGLRTIGGGGGGGGVGSKATGGAGGLTTQNGSSGGGGILLGLSPGGNGGESGGNSPGLGGVGGSVGGGGGGGGATFRFLAGNAGGGGGGGVGGATGGESQGGSGGFGGGGGGVGWLGDNTGGNGGFGGGGGAGVFNTGNPGGGGFGGGEAGTNGTTTVPKTPIPTPGFGGGFGGGQTKDTVTLAEILLNPEEPPGGGESTTYNTEGGGGGGGLGAGGDIFVMSGGTLVIEGGSLGVATVTGGAGGSGGEAGKFEFVDLGPNGDGQPGFAYGGGIFIQGNQSGGQAITLAPGTGQTLVISGGIADVAGSNDPDDPSPTTGGSGGLIINGPGTVILAAANTFSGGIRLLDGTLNLTASDAAGSGPIQFAASPDDETLEFTPADAPSNSIQNFGGYDAITISGFQFTGGYYAYDSTINSNVLVLNGTGGSGQVTLAISGPGLSNLSDFVIAVDPAADTTTIEESRITSGGTQTVGFGDTESGARISGGIQHVYGTASGATIYAGSQVVDNGGVASGTIIYGGTEIVSSGGTDYGALISGGEQHVYGTASGAKIYTGSQVVERGGAATATTVFGGTEVISTGGTDSGALISGGVQKVGVFGTASGATIYAGSQVVSLDGVASATSISGGLQEVFGTASSSIIYNAGSQVVENGGVASATTISGGLEMVDAEGADIGAQINGGTQEIFAAGSASGATIYAGSQVVDGVASGTIVSGGFQEVDFGVASATTVFGGTEIVSGGGTDYGAQISGGVQYVYGTASGATIYAGSQVVENGGVASSTTISGGTEIVSRGGNDYRALISGGEQDVYGTASGATINVGSQVVERGGAATATTISGGTEVVSTGGTDSGALISGGVQKVDVFGTASGATIYAGSQVVDLKGVASATSISGGLQEVFGTASSSIIYNAGSQVVENGGVASATTISGGFEMVEGTDVAAQINGGTQEITAAGYASGVTIYVGSQVVDGVASGTTVSGGTQVVEFGVASATTLFGGTEIVSGGGTDYGAQISGGVQYVYGTASGATIYTGSQVVENGGVASATTISGGDMELAVGGTAGGAITFAGTGGTLQIDGTSMPGNTISGFASSDQFDLAGVAYNADHSADLLTGNLLQVTVAGQQYDLQLAQNFVGDYFHVNPVNPSNYAAGSLVTEDTIPCYCAGTLIATVRGDVPVEELAIGDEVLTLSGESRPIKWIGQRSYRQPFMARSVMPILIKAGALSENVPLRDLYVSPEHAMYLDEVLVPAERLVNGVSVIRCAHVATVQYFHIELDSHDVIFAEGASAETFVVCGNRLMFHNAAEFAELYPGDSSPGWAFCAPRVDNGPVLEQIQRAIAQRAGLAAPDDAAACGPLEGSFDDVSHTLINGWAFDPSQPNVPVWLEVLVNDGVIGRVLADQYRPDLAQISDGFHGFALWLQHGLSPLTRHVIRVRRAADGCELPGSPRVLEARDVPDFLRSPELVLALRTAALGASDDAALDAMLDSLRRGLNEVRQVRAEREVESAEINASGRLLRRSKRGPSKARRALVIDDRLPDATRDAGSNAVLGHMRALIALGFRVEFVPARQNRKDLVPSDRDVAGVRWHRAPAVTSVEDVLRRNADAYELIYLHRLSNALSYAGLARQWCGKAQLIYSVADLHHLRLARRAELQALPQLRAQAQSVKQSELLAMRTVDAVITHSTAEAEYLLDEAPGVGVHVVPWPLTATPCSTPLSARSGLAFIGSVAHDPNVDAVVWLLEQIMPRVWRRDPSITCRIVGAGWPSLVRGPLDRRVQLLGAVPELGTLFDRMRLTVAPLRFGAGIKGKVLDSFAAGVPCVMTDVAAEGLPFTPPLRALVGENPDQLANLIWRAHKDTEFNTKAAVAGLDLISREFSAGRVRSALEAALKRSELRSFPSPRRNRVGKVVA